MKKEEDRYSRLKAIKEFGYDVEWDELKKFHIGIIGVGGLGAITSEIAARCGIGKLTLFDYDIVELVNLNRSLYKPKDIGLLKVEVAKKVLHKINPEVKIDIHAKDIMDLDFEPIFEELIKNMDLILNGVDNLPAREYLNLKCIKNDIPYIDAGASRSGLSGYVHVIIPHKTSCSSCLKRIDLKMPREKAESCTASLPSTMAILGSIQIQEMVKYLLKFGIPIDYLMYNMISGEFTSYKTVRDRRCPICGDSNVSVRDIKGFEGKNEEMDDLIKKLKD